MGWAKRLFGCEVISPAKEDRSSETNEEQMSPGLDGDFDWELREKAGVHNPPPPPEYMGIEGEYDQNGLARRVAIALDQEPALQDIETLKIVQEGSTVRFQGMVPTRDLLEKIVAVASRVDGSKAVDTAQVIVEQL